MGSARNVTDESEAAREHWASQGRNRFYEQTHHWRLFVARRVAALSPTSVLEFGCNAGRNLREVRELLPAAALVGVDINADAVEFGSQAYGLELHVAGEEFLAGLPAAGFDVVLTVSTLDHLPRVEPVFDQLARVARRALLLLEPVTASVGRVDGLPADGRDDGVRTEIPFTYSWDYPALTRRAGDAWQWTWLPYPLSSANLGPYYWMIEGLKRGPVAEVAQP